VTDRAIRVRGAATADEVAAVLAALARRRAATEDAYEQWRRRRIAASRVGSAFSEIGPL
jgi:hypothetical protein